MDTAADLESLRLGGVNLPEQDVPTHWDTANAFREEKLQSAARGRRQAGKLGPIPPSVLQAWQAAAGSQSLQSSSQLSSLDDGSSPADSQASWGPCRLPPGGGDTSKLARTSRRCRSGCQRGPCQPTHMCCCRPCNRVHRCRNGMTPP